MIILLLIVVVLKMTKQAKQTLFEVQDKCIFEMISLPSKERESWKKV